MTLQYLEKCLYKASIFLVAKKNWHKLKITLILISFVFVFVPH
jgi:hypothetical protein